MKQSTTSLFKSVLILFSLSLSLPCTRIAIKSNRSKREKRKGDRVGTIKKMREDKEIEHYLHAPVSMVEKEFIQGNRQR